MSSIFQKPPNNYQYYVSQPAYVDFTVTPEAVAGTTLIVGTLNMPGNTFVFDGQRMFVTYRGQVAGVVGTRTFQVNAPGGNVTLNFNTTEMPAGFWEIRGEYMRVGNDLEIYGYGTYAVTSPVGVAQSMAQKVGRNIITNYDFSQLFQARLTVVAAAGDTITLRSGYLSIF